MSKIIWEVFALPKQEQPYFRREGVVDDVNVREVHDGQGCVQRNLRERGINIIPIQTGAARSIRIVNLIMRAREHTFTARCT